MQREPHCPGWTQGAERSSHPGSSWGDSAAWLYLLTRAPPPPGCPLRGGPRADGCGDAIPPSQGQKEKGMGGACSALAHAPASLTSTTGLILRGAECPHLPMGCPVAISDQHPPAGAQRTLLEAGRSKSVDWPTPLCRAAASPTGLRYANEPRSGACAELGSLLPPLFLPGCLCPVWCFPVPVGSQLGLSSAWLWAASAVYGCQPLSPPRPGAARPWGRGQAPHCTAGNLSSPCPPPAP